MCARYDPRVPKACTEDDANEVRDKKQANFCDYFKPSEQAYAPEEHQADLAARDALASLFEGAESHRPAGDAAASQDDSQSGRSKSATALEQAEALFKRD